MSADPTNPQNDPTGTGRGFTATAGDDAGNGHQASDALKDALRHVAEIKEYGQYYLSAMIDSYKASLRKMALMAVLGVFGLLVGGTVLIVAAVQLMQGIAGGLGALFHGRVWVGELVVGVVVLGLTTVVLLSLIGRLSRTWREQTVAKYESKKRRQRTGFGRDVDDAAAGRS